MPRETQARVTSIAPESRPRAPNPTELLRDIIGTQVELGRAGLDPVKVVDVITRRAQELTRSTSAVVEMRDGDDLVYWSASGDAVAQRGLRIPLQGSLSGCAVLSGKALRCDDADSDPRVNRDACRRVGLRSAIAMPLTDDGQLVGVLKVISPWPHAYDARDVETLELLGGFIGAMLHHALQHDRLRLRQQIADDAEAALRRDRDAVRDRVRAMIDAPDLIRPVYQPIVELATGREVGLEGLSRFPEHYGRRPDQWFADATDAGLGAELELSCARRVLGILPDLPGATYIGVNLSPGALASPELEQLITPDVAPRVVLEITETSEVADYEELASRLASFRALGARLAVDDAGAGFASLRHVLRLSPDSIKLDVSLTRGIDANRPRQTLASAMLMFASDTSAVLVAEGIETEEELDALQRIGVQFGQGYLLGRPAPR